MDAYLRPLVSCRLHMTIIRQRKKDFGEIGKIEKYSQKNVYVKMYDFKIKPLAKIIESVHLENIHIGFLFSSI